MPGCPAEENQRDLRKRSAVGLQLVKLISSFEGSDIYFLRITDYFEPFTMALSLQIATEIYLHIYFYPGLYASQHIYAKRRLRDLERDIPVLLYSFREVARENAIPPASVRFPPSTSLFLPHHSPG